MYAGRMPRKQTGPDRVRSWPFVSLSIRPEQLAEWTALAQSLGRSRADLLREVLAEVGLPYAKAVLRHRGVSSAPAPAAADGAINRAGDTATAIYPIEEEPSRRSA